MSYYENNKEKVFQQNHLTECEMQAFIGSKANNFNTSVLQVVERRNLKKMYAVNFKNRNWFFFFLGPIWLIYRKMYLISIVYWAILIVLGVIFDYYNLHFPIYIISFVFASYISIYYCEWVAYKINKIKLKLLNKNIIPNNQEEFLMVLGKKGGVNLPAAIIVSVLTFGIIALSIALDFLEKSHKI